VYETQGLFRRHDELRQKTWSDPIFCVALFAGRPGGTGKKVKDQKIDVALRFLPRTAHH
jgi:hypothetical protein